MFEATPRVKRHPKGSHVNSTPAVDGRHVVAFFGSQGMACYGMDGELLWKKDMGSLDWGWYDQRQAQWGFGSSPIIHEGRVLMQCDVQEGSFLAALDVEDGREVWRTPRDEVPTWSTPTRYSNNGIQWFAEHHDKHIGRYEFSTGKKAWKLEGGDDIHVVKAGPEFEKLAENAMSEICMATPAISDGTLLFRTKGHLVAIALR